MNVPISRGLLLALTGDEVLEGFRLGVEMNVPISRGLRAA
jgi:hypothetical protein